MAAIRHLGFSKIWFLRTGTPWAANFPSPYKFWCKNVDRRRNYGQKSKSKMAAVRHLGFVTPSYRTTHEVYSLDYIALSNFMLIRWIVLKIWRFEFFVDLAWNAYSCPTSKSKMADGRHVGFRCRAIISVSINILAPNFVPRWKIGSPRGSSSQKSDFRKSKMADGRHLGFRFWAAISSSFNIIAPNFVQWWKIDSTKWPIAQKSVFENPRWRSPC